MAFGFHGYEETDSRLSAKTHDSQRQRQARPGLTIDSAGMQCHRRTERKPDATSALRPNVRIRSLLPKHLAPGIQDPIQISHCFRSTLLKHWATNSRSVRKAVVGGRSTWVRRAWQKGIREVEDVSNLEAADRPRKLPKPEDFVIESQLKTERERLSPSCRRS